MAYIIKEELFEQKTPNSVWTIPLKTGYSFPFIEKLFDENNNPVDWEYTLSTNENSIVLDFGIEQHIGAVIYKWRQESTVVEEDGNVVNITVNQTNDNDENLDHQIINITNTKIIEVENKSIHSRHIKVYQFIGEENGVKTYQDFTESVDLLFKDRVSDGKRFIKIESNLPITGFIELY